MSSLVALNPVSVQASIAARSAADMRGAFIGAAIAAVGGGSAGANFSGGSRFSRGVAWGRYFGFVAGGGMDSARGVAASSAALPLASSSGLTGWTDHVTT